jgi:exonuclease SbcC
LKSQPRDRREILRDLLRLQIYERMRELARKQQDQLGGRTQNLEERLQHEYAGVTAAALQEQREQLQQLKAANKERAKEIKKLDAELAALRVRFDKSCELVAKRETLHGLAQREAEINALSEKLAAAIRASAVVPAVEAAANQEKVAHEAAGRAADAARARDSAQQVHEAAQAELTKRQKAAERIAALRERVSALDQLAGVLEARAAAAKRKTAFEQSKQKGERELADLEAKSQAASKALRNADGNLQKAVAALVKAPFDKALGARLDAAREKATQLTALRESLDGDRKEAVRLAGESKQQEATAKALQTTAQELAEALVHATEDWKGADDALREAERHNAGLVLRGTLALGEPCPVCEQPVAKLPRKHKAVELEKLKTRLEQCRTAMERAKTAADAARDAAITTASSVEAAKKAAAVAAKKAEVGEERLARAESDLEARVGDDTRKEKGTTIEERVLVAAKRAAEARERFEAATQLHRTAELAQQKAKHAYEQINGKLTASRERLDAAVAQIQQTDTEIAALTAQIQNVSTAPDPLGERKGLAGEIGELEKNLKAAQVAESKASSASAAAIEGARHTAANAATAQEAAAKARQRAHEAALEAGFPDEVVAVQAAIPRDRQREIETAVNQFKRERGALEKRVGDLEAEIGSDLVTSQQFEEVEKQAKEERRRYEEAIRAEASLETTVETLQQRLEVAEQLSAELRSVKEGHRIYKQLADDLRSERFQAYLLDEAFRELVAGASVRLMELSGRYTFDYRDDAFFVLDHDNAQEQRSTDTLSGGETFLASLALALELSQQVQRAAGAVSLDSLFIDEGFGTLDAETLDTVASAIESLRVGGRMVGIITHIPELTVRLPERIMVEKRTDGSRVSVEAD